MYKKDIKPGVNMRFHIKYLSSKMFFEIIIVNEWTFMKENPKDEH